MERALLKMNDIKKTYYPDIVAVDGASFSLKKGEIHALAGENGAGKTTLMKILFGLTKADGGTIMIDGETVDITTPNDAMSHGIGMVHQHFMLVEGMTVADNIVLGMEPKKHGLYDYESACGLTRTMSERYDMPIDPDALIKELSVGLKQKVEIMKVLARESDIIILDEPTAVLTPQETNELFHQLRLLKKSGHTIVIITHKLREIKEICNRVTIMKAGKTIGTHDVDAISIEEISKEMVGYDFELPPISKKKKTGDVVLSVEDLTVMDTNGKYRLKDIGFSVAGGEILGVVGVEGNGQETLARVLTGAISTYDGQVDVDGTSLKGKNIRKIRDRGVAFIPEDRMSEGVDLDGTVLETAMVLKARQDKYRKGIFLDTKQLVSYTKDLIREYRVKCDSHKDTVRFLSGGNVQKIVSAREIDDSERLLVANQPTRGIDIGAVLTLHEKLKELQDNGKAVLLISSDLKEIHDLATRVVVFYEGEIVARIDDIPSVSEEQLGRYMLGLERQQDGGKTS